MSIKLPDVKEMFLTGMHFGHKKERSHPKARGYIFGIRDGVNVINLDKTQEMLKLALDFITREVSQGKIILFVGTKRQIKDAVTESAIECDMPYATTRWLGGTLTNFETIKKGIATLISHETKLADPNSEMIKKERTVLEKEVSKLKNIYDGIRNLKQMPDIMFVVDVVKEHNAVKEAKTKGITIVGICDTDANPSNIDWCIPANDDAKASVEMILKLVTQAVLEGKKGSEKKTVEPEVVEEKVEEVEGK